MTIVVVGLVLEYQTLGVTRQSLPSVWPLAILHIMIAQLSLRKILGPIERVAVRGILARAVRGVLVMVMVTTGWSSAWPPVVICVAAQGDRAFLVFFLFLAAVGFTAGLTPSHPTWLQSSHGPAPRRRDRPRSRHPPSVVTGIVGPNH